MRLTESRIHRLIRHYAPFLGLAHWTYDLLWDPNGDPEDEGEGDDGPRTWAYVQTDPKSEYFLLTFFPDTIRDRCKKRGWDLGEEVGSTVIHELLHVMWSPWEDLFVIPEGAQSPVDHLREPIVERTARLLYEHLPRA